MSADIEESIGRVALVVLWLIAIVGALALGACHPIPEPAPGPQPPLFSGVACAPIESPGPDAVAVCQGRYTPSGLPCVACGAEGAYSCVDKDRGVYCVAKGIGCADSTCAPLPMHR